MPDIVNDDDLSALAAEYVLGTLEPDERTRANVLLDVDHGFRGLVRVWERRLGELHLMVEPVEPDSRIWDRIRVKAGGISAAPVLQPGPAPRLSEPVIEETLAAKTLAAKTLAAKTPETVAETKPVELKPAEPRPEETKPAEPKSPEIQTAEQKLAELILEVEKFGKRPEPAPLEGWDAAKAEPEPAEAPQPAELRAPERVTREPAVLLPVPTDRLPAAVDRTAGVRRRGPCRALASLMTVLAFALGGLIAAWRFIPERLPEPLRPLAILKIGEVPQPPAKKRLPPGFEE